MSALSWSLLYIQFIHGLLSTERHNESLLLHTVVAKHTALQLVCAWAVKVWCVAVLYVMSRVAWSGAEFGMLHVSTVCLRVFCITFISHWTNNLKDFV